VKFTRNDVEPDDSGKSIVCIITEVVAIWAVLFATGYCLVATVLIPMFNHHVSSVLISCVVFLYPMTYYAIETLMVSMFNRSKE